MHRSVNFGLVTGGWRRRFSYASLIWLVASLLAALVLLWSGGAPRDADRSAARAAAAAAERPLVTKPIADIQLGERVAGRNPLRHEVDETGPQVDAASWRKLRLRMTKADGQRLDIELLRPVSWLEASGAAVGGAIYLDLPELGAVGEADVLGVGPCPAIRQGRGSVVTGKFIHAADGNLVDLRLAGQTEATGVTDNHPYWSLDRQAFTPAGQLRAGERVDTAWGSTTVQSIAPRPGEEVVYNLEVHGQHVYRVGSLGTLVHNSYVGAAKSAATHVGASSADEVYGGVRQASEYLKSIGVPRAERLRIVQSFDVRTIRLGVAGDDMFALRFHDFGSKARPSGQYLFETFGPLTNRANLALPSEWNLATGIKQWRVKPGAVYLRGRVAPQLGYGPQYVGGAEQIFLYKPWINGTLLEP